MNQPLPITRETSAIIESLPRITVQPRRLNDALWGPCILCQRGINDCECDPDVKFAAIARGVV